MERFGVGGDVQGDEVVMNDRWSARATVGFKEAHNALRHQPESAKRRAG